MKEGYHVISAATASKLFEKLIDEFYREPNYLDIILLTYPYWTNATAFLGLLVALHNKEAAKPWQKRIKLRYSTHYSVHTFRALRILKTWIGSYSSFLKTDPEFMNSFRQFVNSSEETQKEQIFQKFLVFISC